MFKNHKNIGLNKLCSDYEDLFISFERFFEFPVSIDSLQAFNLKLKKENDIKIKFEDQSNRIDYIFNIKDKKIHLSFNFKKQDQYYYLLSHELSYTDKFFMVTDEHTHIMLKNVKPYKEMIDGYYDYTFELNHKTKTVNFLKKENEGTPYSKKALYSSLAKHLERMKKQPFVQINNFLTNNFDDFCSLIFVNKSNLLQAYEIEQLTNDQNKDIELIISGYLFSADLKIKENIFDKGLKKLQKIML